MVDDVPVLLHNLASLFEEKNKQYANAFMENGAIFALLFPKGIELKSEEDFRRFCLFMMLVHKLTRYANSWAKGGHDDSLDDLAVYAMMNKFSDNKK